MGWTFVIYHHALADWVRLRIIDTHLYVLHVRLSACCCVQWQWTRMNAFHHIMIHLALQNTERNRRLFLFFSGCFFRRLAEDLCHSTSPGRPQLQDSTLRWRYGLNVVVFKPCAKITFARTFQKLKWKNVNKWILNKLNATLKKKWYFHQIRQKHKNQIRAVDFSISIDKSDAVSYSAVGIYSERSRPRMKKLQKIPWSHHSFFLKWLKKPCTKKRLKRPFFKDL